MTDDEKLNIVNYTELRSELSENQKIPERWGTIMLPLSTGILALAVNSFKGLPEFGVIILVFLSIATIFIWRLIDYNSMRLGKIITERLQHLEAGMEIRRSDGWQRYYSYSTDPYFNIISQRRLLDIFAALYIATGIIIIIVKHTSY